MLEHSPKTLLQKISTQHDLATTQLRKL